MSSILTNTGAMVALQTLRNINSNLSKVQNEISTGKAVASAKDNAAVWAISKVMESDVAGFKGISDSLALGHSSLAVARTAAENVSELLKEIKSKVVAAQEENVDRAKLQTDIEELRRQIAGVVNAAQFNGLNLVKGTDTMKVLASLDRDSSGQVTSSFIDVARKDLTTEAGVYNISGTNLTPNTTITAGTLSNAGNTAEITFTTGAYGATTTARVTVAGVEINYTGGTGEDETTAAAYFAGQINALQLEGITASSAGGVLTITSTRAFETTAVSVSNLAGGAVGTAITQLNGAAYSGTSGDISERAEWITFSNTAAVQNGDGYRVVIGSHTFDYIAGPGQTFEDVAKGLKAAIDAKGLTGITTHVRQASNGSWELMVDNDTSTALTFTRAGNAGGEASGGLYGLDGIDVTTEAGARAALANIETFITRAINSAASFGSSQKRVDIQRDFVRSLVDSFTAGIGSLVDADMEAASARLQALQVQQQLGIQALSIANQQPQNILALFR